VWVQTTDPTIGGNDTITAGAGNDTIFGGTGSDSISGAGGADLIFGDHGRVDASGAANVNFLSIDTAATAGGGADPIHGGTGDDLILGDGALVSATVNGVTAWTASSFEATTDGDDYVEGNGGNDTIYGGLGQDDLIGGSSSLFSLTTPSQRPDGSDLIFGGAG